MERSVQSAAFIEGRIWGERKRSAQVAHHLHTPPQTAHVPQTASVPLPARGIPPAHASALSHAPLRTAHGLSAKDLRSDRDSSRKLVHPRFAAPWGARGRVQRGLPSFPCAGTASRAYRVCQPG
ncbi:hypothetical protein NN561_007099 [Cricetulus griseus]